MPGHFNDEGYGPESSGSAGSDGGGVDTGDHDGDEQYGSDTDDSSSPSNDNSPGHPANAPTGSTGSTGPGAGGPSVGSGGGGVDTGDHDGDEQYGSDTDDSSSPSNDNSPGHPANAPTGSTGSTGPGAGGPSVGNDGGGVDTGDHDGDEQYGSDTDDSSSPSNDNSPGHPANAPTGSTGSTGPGAGGPSVGNDGGGVDTGDHDGDEQYGSDTGGSSSPSNQTSPGHPANAPTDSRRRPSNENSPGHPANAPTGNTGPGAGGPSVGINHLLEAGVPTVSRVTPDNAGDAWASHKSIVDEALAVLERGGTPEQLAAAAASVEQIADAWRGSGVTAKDGLLMADHLDKMVKTLSVASDNRTYQGTVTPDNAAVAWAEHRPVIDQAVAILAAGGTPAELDAAAAQVAKIAAAWRGSGVTADDGTPMTNHLDGLVQSLSESSEITQSNYDQRAEFERVFREITKREPSGDLAKDADILSRYGENALTDMGYAGEVQAFEKLFREVTKREPSGDLAKDADILSRYGENALTDMGYAAEVQAFEKTFRDTTGREPSGDLVKDADILSRYGENALTDGDFVMGLTSEPSDLIETWGGKEAVYITSDKQPTDDESEAAFRIVTQEDGTPLVESIDRYDPTNPWDLRSRYDEEGKRYTSTGLHPGRVLGASDQNQAAAEIVDQNMVGRHIDQWGTIELPDQNRATMRHAGGPRGKGTTTQVEIRGVPQKYIAGWDEKGEPILAPGWEEAVVPLSLNRSRIEGLNPDNTYQTGDPTLWARAKPWVSVVPGASTLIKLSDIKHPGSGDGSQITGREWREFGAEALVDSVYLVGWPYGAINLARGVGIAAAKGGLKAAGKQTLHMARPDRLAKTMLWEPSLPNVSRIVTRQGVNTVKNLRNPLTSIGTKGKGTLKGLASETGEELLVEYPFEVASPYIFGVADPAKPLFTGDWSDPLSVRPGSGWIPSRDDALWMGGSVGVFGVLEGVGGRRFSPGGGVEIPTFEGPQSAGRRDFSDGGQHLPGGTRWQPSGEMRRHHHLPHEPSAGFHEGGAFDAWPSGWAFLMPPAPGGYQRSGSGLLLPTPTPTAMAPPVPSLTPGETPSPAPTPAPTPTPTDTPIPTPTPTPSNPPTRAGAIPRSRFPDRIVTVVPGPAPSSTISTAISPTPTDPPSFPTPRTWKSIALPTPVPPPGPPGSPAPPSPITPPTPPIDPPTPTVPLTPDDTPTPTKKIGIPDPTETPTPTETPDPTESPTATPTPNRGVGSTVPRAGEYVPQVVQWRSENQNILDLRTGEHTIVPLSDIHMATFDVVQVGKEKPLPDVAAGALRVTSSGQYAVPQYRSQPSRTRNSTAKQPARGSRQTGKLHPYLDRRDGVRKRRRR